MQPDVATKAAAMQAGEMDWWENPTTDLLPLLRKHKIATPILDPTGVTGRAATKSSVSAIR